MIYAQNYENNITPYNMDKPVCPLKCEKGETTFFVGGMKGVKYVVRYTSAKASM